MPYYVAPSSKIYLLGDIPFDNTYRHTLYFQSWQSQKDYFLSKKQYEFDAQSYQRVENGVLRVGICADDIIKCNYMMFQNTAFGSKWFYAFVNDIEYVNNSTSKITYELDVIQTWWDDYTVMDSFVEREMSLTDNPGDNIVPENIDTGDYMYDNWDDAGNQITNYKIVVAATFDKELNDAQGNMYGGVYSALRYNVFNTAAEVNTFIERATEQHKAPEGVIGIFMMPSMFVNMDASDTTITHMVPFAKTRAYEPLDGYVPKCKKLYTYPYNSMFVTNLEGNSAPFPFEYFSGDFANFEVTATFCLNPEMFCIPMDYKGLDKNYEEKLGVQNFPLCPYNTDAFKAWTASNNVGILGSVLGGIGSIALGAAATATGALAPAGVGMIAGGVSSIVGVLGKGLERSMAAPQSHNAGGFTLTMARKIKGFHYYRAHVRRQFAEIIDDYFNAFGYATHEVKRPNFVARPYWNFIKTQNVCLTPHIMPNGDLKKIAEIYDRGITFWRHPNLVGQYSNDNSPA